MTILHEESNNQGRHFINDESGSTIAEITYTVKGADTLVVSHTGVDEELRGQHVGEQLVEAVVKQARAEGKKIVPLCSFAKAIIERKKEYSDVLG